ncbi:MAG: helix-turn-helix domain-containing protein [Eubacterium sp.]
MEKATRLVAQEELAQQLSVSRQSVSKWESGVSHS